MPFKGFVIECLMSMGSGSMLGPAWPEKAKKISQLTHPSATAMSAVPPESKKIVLSFFARGPDGFYNAFHPASLVCKFPPHFIEPCATDVLKRFQ